MTENKEKKMKAFSDLGVAELRRSAAEDFAVEIEPNASKNDIVAEFVAQGIKWADYVKQHPDIAEPAEPEDNLKETLRAGGTITSADVTGRAVEVPEEPVKVRTAEPAIKATADKYLLKMTRDNLLYETRGYRFTQEHPYALVDAEDAQYILSREDGFRQAFPNELEEFYG